MCGVVFDVYKTSIAVTYNMRVGGVMLPPAYEAVCMDGEEHARDVCNMHTNVRGKNIIKLYICLRNCSSQSWMLRTTS